MPEKVFYAWQSDRDQAVCHYFIRDALKAAIKIIAKDEDGARLTEASRPELDHDRKGVSGTPRIAETIEKKIKRAAVFVADVTAVGDLVTYDGRKKQTPNANVMIELGMAFRAVKSERIILLMNAAFGPPENLPFDLKDRSHPIQYNLTGKSDPEFKAKQKRLSRDLIEPLKSCLNHHADTIKATAVATRETKAQQQRERAERLWVDFKERLLGGKFREVEAGTYIAACLVPLEPISTLDLSQVDRGNRLSHLIAPMGSRSGWNTSTYGHSYVTHNGRAERGNRPAEKPTTVTELTDEGVILAVDRSHVVEDTKYGKAVYLNADELRVFESIARYVRLLRLIGVGGRIELRIMLSGVLGAKLLPNNPFYWFDHEFRGLDRDVVEIGPIVLGSDIDGESTAALAEAVRPYSEVIWKDAGVARDPCFNNEGKFDPSNR